MKIREITEPAPAAEPTPQQIQQGQQMLGTIDPARVAPEQATQTLTGWLKQYPWLDRVTDLLPATRLVKTVAQAIDAIQAGDPKQALEAFATAATGGIARSLQQANQVAQTGSALAQGDVKSAALSLGGRAGQVAQTADRVTNLSTSGDDVIKAMSGAPGAQSHLIAQAGQALGGRTGQAIQAGAHLAQNNYQGAADAVGLPKVSQAIDAGRQLAQTALAPQTNTESIEQIKHLAGLPVHKSL